MTTYIVKFSDAISELNLPGTPSDGGVKLQNFINAAQAVIEDMVGHVIDTTVTEIYDGGNTTIYLRQLPVLSITSIVETIGLIDYNLTNQPVGAPVDNFGFSLDDPNTGRITRRSAGSQPFPFYKNTGNVSVTYTAGRTTVPPNIYLATLELLRFWWQQGQQGLRPGFGQPTADTGSPTPMGFLVPNRVKELCQPSLRQIVIA